MYMAAWYVSQPSKSKYISLKSCFFFQINSMQSPNGILNIVHNPELADIEQPKMTTQISKAPKFIRHSYQVCCIF